VQRGAVDAGIVGHGLQRSRVQRRFGGRARLAAPGHEQGWQEGGGEAREGKARHRRRFFVQASGDGNR
jgi:hypothetical protein